MLHTGGDNKIIRCGLLEHEPLHLDIIPGMTPVSFGIHITQIQAVLETEKDPGQGPGDLPGNKGLTAQGRFMIEQDAVAGIDAIGLAVVHHDPVGVHLGDRIRRTGIKWRCLLLGGLLHLAKQLRSRGLIESGGLGQTEDTDRLKQAQGTQRIGVGGILRLFKGYCHMGLGREIVYLIGFDLFDNVDQAR